MAPSDKSVKLRLLAEVDKATAKASEQSVALIRKEYEAVDKAAGTFAKRVGRYFETGERAARDAKAAVSAMQKELAHANTTWGDPRSVQVARTRVETFRDELDEARALVAVQEQRVHVEERINSTQRARPAAGGVDRAQAAGDVSTGLSAIGAVLPGGAGDAFRTAGDLAGVAENLPRLTAGFQGLVGASAAAGTGITGLVATLGPIALVAGAAAIGFTLIKKSIDEANRESERRIAVTKILLGLERELTTQQAKDRQAEVKAQLDQLAAEKAANEQARQEILAGLDEDTNAGLVGLLGTHGLGAFNKAAEENQAETEKAAAELEGLNKLLDENAFAANDAAAAEKLLAEERTKGLIAEVQAAAALRLEIDSLKASATSGQIEDMIAATQREIAVRQQEIRDLNALVGATEEGRAQIDALRVEIENLSDKERLLKEEVVGVVAAREREIAALQAQNDLLKTTQDKAREVAATQKQFNEAIKGLEQQTTKQREQIIQQSADRILDIETRLADGVAGALRDAERANDAARRKLDDDIAKVGQEEADQEIAFRQETADRINDLEERAADERKRILRDFNRSANQAIQDRDAVALDQARQTRDDALEDSEKGLKQGVKEEREALKQRLDEQKRNNEQRLRDLRQSYEQETRERQIALDQKIADLQQNAANEISLTRQKQQEALTALNQAYAEQRAALLAKYAEQFKLLTGHYVSLNELTATALNDLYDKWEGFYNDLAGSVLDAQSGTSTSGSYVDRRHEQGPGRLGGYARGVQNAKPGWNVVGEKGPEPMWVPGGSNIYSNREGREMFGGASVTMGEGAVVIYTQSADAQGIMREVREQFPDMMADTYERLNRGRG